MVGGKIGSQFVSEKWHSVFVSVIANTNKDEMENHSHEREYRLHKNGRQMRKVLIGTNQNVTYYYNRANAFRS